MFGGEAVSLNSYFSSLDFAKPHLGNRNYTFLAALSHLSKLRSLLLLRRIAFRDCRGKEIIAASPLCQFLVKFRLGIQIACCPKYLIEQIVASGLIYLNSHARDFKNPEIRPYLDRYLRGSNGYKAEERVKLLKLLWDTLATEFGGRHELYEINYGGSTGFGAARS